jgi:hypothetical protein
VCGNRGLDCILDIGFGPNINESSFIVSNEKEEMMMALKVPNGAPLPALFPKNNVFENFLGDLSKIVGRGLGRPSSSDRLGANQPPHPLGGFE